MPKASNGGEQGHNFWDIALNGLDDSTTPAILAFGTMGRDSNGVWHYGNVSANGYFMVSGTFGSGSFTAAPLSADSSTVSAKQGDAGLLHISAYAGDAGLFRVSAIGGTAGDHTLVDGTTQTISATLTPISASPANTTTGLVTNTFQFDAGKFHVSALQGDTASPFRSSAVSAFAMSAKASTGVVNQYHAWNPNTTDAYLQFYDNAPSAVSVGTTVPNRTLWIPAGGAMDGAWPIPLKFTTAITIAATSTISGSASQTTGLLVDLGFI